MTDRFHVKFAFISQYISKVTHEPCTDCNPSAFRVSTLCAYPGINTGLYFFSHTLKMLEVMGSLTAGPNQEAFSKRVHL